MTYDECDVCKQPYMVSYFSPVGSEPEEFKFLSTITPDQWAKLESVDSRVNNACMWCIKDLVDKTKKLSGNF